MTASRLAGRAILIILAGIVLLLSSCARHFHAQGIVLAVDRPHQLLTISHRAIPGYMEAMSMPFHVESPRDLDQLQPGARIDFQLKVTRSAAVARHIHLQQTALDGIQVPPAEGKIAVGGMLPDFTLLAQDAGPVTLSSFRGQLVLVDFIYTRCPLPDVCPRLSANFARVAKRFAGRIVLLSITLDPQHDTPPVLSEYAGRWRADPRTWRFLTGPEEEIRKVAGYFGVVYWPEEGAITHTSSTAIIDRDGRLAAVVEGSSFTSQQLLDLVTANLVPNP